MGFEPHQPPSHFKAVNEFTDRMKDTLEEAKSALAKAKDDMAWYYNRCRSPASSFSPDDMVYLDSEEQGILILSSSDPLLGMSMS